MNKQSKLNIRKYNGYQLYKVQLAEGQELRFVDKQGITRGMITIQNGELSMWSHRTLKYHTWW